MHSIMYPNLSSKPILGIVTIILILVCLFAYTGINTGDIFTTEGFAKIYNEKPWIIYLGVGITMYALISIWTSFRASNIRYTRRMVETENFDGSTENLMTFDNFFKKNFMIQSEDSNESLLMENTYMILRTKIDGQNYYMVMANNDESGVHSHIPAISTRKEVMPRPCKISIEGKPDRYIRPILMREDILGDLYESYLGEIKSKMADIESMDGDVAASAQVAMGSDYGSMPSIKLNSPSPASIDTFDGSVGGIINIKRSPFVDHVETFLDKLGEVADNVLQEDQSEVEKKTYYPKFIHHFTTEYQGKDVNPFGQSINPEDPNKPSSPAYTMAALDSYQAIDITNSEALAPFLMTVGKSLWVDSQTFMDSEDKSVDDRMFICGRQLGSGNLKKTSPSNAIYSESYAPPLEELVTAIANKQESSNESSPDVSSDVSSDDMSEIRVISDPSMIEAHEKLASRVNLYFYKDGQKYYIAKLNGFKTKGEVDADPNPNADDSVASSDSTDAMSSQTVQSDQSELSSPDTIPVGIVPENYIRPEFPTDAETDFSLAEKINFDVIMVRLSPLA